MKKLLLFAVAATLWGFGCNDNSIDPDHLVPLASEVNAHPESVTSVTLGDDGDVSVVVTSIEDSRCPINAICVWAGNASVKVRFSQGDNDVEVELCIGACGNHFKETDSRKFSLNDRTYVVVLKDVRPYPATDSDEKPTVVLDFYPG